MKFSSLIAMTLFFFSCSDVLNSTKNQDVKKRESDITTTQSSKTSDSSESSESSEPSKSKKTTNNEANISENKEVETLSISNSKNDTQPVDVNTETPNYETIIQSTQIETPIIYPTNNSTVNNSTPIVSTPEEPPSTPEKCSEIQSKQQVQNDPCSSVYASNCYIAESDCVARLKADYQRCHSLGSNCNLYGIKLGWETTGRDWGFGKSGACYVSGDESLTQWICRGSANPNDHVLLEPH